jgi:hypothetical protein
MAYSQEFWKKPEGIKKEEVPAVPLELLAKQTEEQSRLKVNEQGQVMTGKELEEQKKLKTEGDAWREQK